MPWASPWCSRCATCGQAGSAVTPGRCCSATVRYRSPTRVPSRVLVLDRHPPQVPDAGDSGPDGLGRGRLDTGAVEDAGQDLAGRPGHLRRMRLPGIGRDGDIQVGAVPGPGQPDVQVFAGHRRVDQQMRDLDGGALGAVDGAGVVQLHMRRHIVGGQGDPAAMAAVGDGQRAVVVHGLDEPGVAVLHPVPTPAHREPAVVAAGRDPVPHPGGGAVPQRDRRRRRRGRRRSGRPGPGRSGR